MTAQFAPQVKFTDPLPKINAPVKTATKKKVNKVVPSTLVTSESQIDVLNHKEQREYKEKRMERILSRIDHKTKISKLLKVDSRFKLTQD